MSESAPKISEEEEEENPSPKKLFGIRHFQLSLMFITLFLFYGQRTTLSVAIIAMINDTPPTPDIPTYPSWDNTDRILSSFFWGYVVSQVIAGQLAERFGPKWFLAATMVTGSISMILIPTMADVLGSTGVIVCRIVQGLSQGFLYPSTHNLVSRWAPLSERTRISGLVYSGSTLGIVISMIVAGAISASNLGWPSVFYFYGGGGLLWVIIFVIFLVNSPSQHKSISSEEKLYIESSNFVSKEKKKVPTPWRHIATSLPLWANFITCCAQSWGSFTLLTEIPSFLNNIANFDMNSNSLLSSLPYFVMFLMNLVGPPISDRLISNRILSIGTSRKIFNSLGSFLAAAALFSLGFINKSERDLAVVLLVVAVGSTAFANSGAMVNSIDLAPNHAGTLFALTNGLSQIFSILGPLTVGFFGSDKTEMILWKKVFWLAAGFYLLGGVIFVIFGSGEVQKWNDLEKDEENLPQKKQQSDVSVNVCT